MARLLRTQNAQGVTARLYDFRNLDEKLHHMRDMITRDREHPAVRNMAVRILRDSGCEQYDKKEQALCIADWIQQNCFYVHEFPERLAHAWRTIEDKAGDCDDYTIAIAAMLESCGIPCVQCCMQVNGHWKHIFPAAVLEKPGGRATLMPLDATLRDPIRARINPVLRTMSQGKAVKLKLA